MPTPRDPFEGCEYVPYGKKDGFWLERVYEPDSERCLKALMRLFDDKPRSTESKISKKGGTKHAQRNQRDQEPRH